MSHETKPSPRYIIEIGEITAGVALSESGGFAFVASDPRFAALERRSFRTPGRIVEAACALVAPPRRRPQFAGSAGNRRPAATQAA